jgi:signal transduction histidine kinase
MSDETAAIYAALIPRVQPAESAAAPAHPRTIGWVGTAALAMGGSNQSLFLIAALFIGQGDIPGQGSAAVPLLIVGLMLSLFAAPGWVELVLLNPNRVGGIAAACAEAFRPYSPILANLAGVGYWWGWIPTCGLTALLSASAIHQWYLTNVPIPGIATGLVLFFLAVNLCGVKWVARLTVPIAVASSTLAFLSGFLPIVSGAVDWHQATTFHLTTPFPGGFGAFTSMMAGLYLIGFAAPAFEAATCHVGETVDPARNVPRAVFASAMMAVLYFAVLPVVWLGVLGPDPLGGDLALVLGPTYAPLFGSAAKAAAIGFMIFTMFHGTVQPLAGAARTLSQLSDDGLVPRFLGRRSANDTPWIASVATAVFAIVFLYLGDPIWLIASANFTYLIGIALPSVAVWLLRRDQPDLPRPWRAPPGTVLLGVSAAMVWGVTAIFGFQQFGLPTVLIGLGFFFSGALLFLWRKFDDRVRAGLPGVAHTLHVKLTGAMLLVLMLDGIGYLIAVNNVPTGNPALVAVLADIFVAVAMLTIAVGMILPGMIAHSVVQVSQAANRLVNVTLAEFVLGMKSLGRGDLDQAHAQVDFSPVTVNSRDEIGQMAENFNLLQRAIVESVIGLDAAREGLARSRRDLVDTNASLEASNHDLRVAKDAAEAANAAKSAFLAAMSHELRTPLNAILGFSEIIQKEILGPVGTPIYRQYADDISRSGKHLLSIINDVLDMAKMGSGKFTLHEALVDINVTIEDCRPMVRQWAEAGGVVMNVGPIPGLPLLWADRTRVNQILINLLSNAVKFTPKGGTVSVDARLRDDGALALIVADTGIGMTEEQVALAMQPFRQIDSSLARQYEGTGLGLPLTEGLMQLHGGHLTLTPAPSGPGTVATAIFPAERVRPV